MLTSDTLYSKYRDGKTTMEIAGLGYYTFGAIHERVTSEYISKEYDLTKADNLIQRLILLPHGVSLL